MSNCSRRLRRTTCRNLMTRGYEAETAALSGVAWMGVDQGCAWACCYGSICGG